MVGSKIREIYKIVKIIKQKFRVISNNLFVPLLLAQNGIKLKPQVT